MAATQQQEQRKLLEADHKQLEEEEEEEEAFSFPVSSPSRSFIESPRLLWRRLPTTAYSSPANGTTKLEFLRSKYQRRSFSCMETESVQMMMMTTTMPAAHHHSMQDYDGDRRRMSGDFNKMDLLWEDLHELSNSKKYSDASSDLDQAGSDRELGGFPKRRRAASLPVRRRPPGTVAIFKVLKKLFYVRKTGSNRSF